MIKRILGFKWGGWKSAAMLTLLILFGITGCMNSDCQRDAPIFKVGDQRLAIPLSYLKGLNPESVVMRQRCGGDRDDVGIDALLPDFRPVPSDAPEHKGGGPGRVVGVLITKKQPGVTIDAMFRRGSYGTQEVENSSVGNQIGLKHYADPHPNGDDLFVDLDKGVARIEIRCHRNNEIYIFPSCRMYMDYSSGAYMYASFGRTHLAEWRAIKDGVLQLVKTFEVGATEQSTGRKP